LRPPRWLRPWLAAIDRPAPWQPILSKNPVDATSWFPLLFQNAHYDASSHWKVKPDMENLPGTGQSIFFLSPCGDVD
jgi:hypothetical protein